jgi:molecular chaperone HtpG
VGQRFRVDLRAVVDLLARHVYSSPRVFVRELLQNGVDAVTARRLVDPEAPLGPIVLRPADAGGDGALIASDPGIGLTLTEVHELLATIGGSSKRVADGEEAESFLGRFGIGLLSCFVVADRLEVVTRSVTGTPPVRFVGRDDGTYEVTELAADDPAAPVVGTSVRLDPRPDMRSWVDADLVERLAARYGVALPVPVEVHRPDGTVVDVTDPDLPWMGAVTGANRDRRTAQVAWCEQQFGFRPLDVIPIRSATTGVEGVAFVLPHEAHAAAAPGHRAYLRRMLLADEQRDLLPDWAFFVRAVLDVGQLKPTASRESLMDDDDRATARDELGEEVRRWLLELGERDPDRLADVLDVHGRSAKALAAVDDDVFRALAPWLRFQTSAGDLTIEDLHRRFGVIRFTPTIDRFRQMVPIAAAQGLAVVNAGYTYDQDLLRRAGTVVAGAEAVALEDVDVVATLDHVSADRERLAARFLDVAGAALVSVGCDVELRSFEPAVVPVLFLHDDDARARRRLRTTTEQVDDAWAGLLADLDDGGDDRPRLVANDRHPLVRRLVDAAAGDRDVVSTAVRALYGQALLLGHHPLRAADLDLLNHALLDLVDGILDT